MDETMRAFIILMKEAFSLAKSAHNCSFDDPELGRKEDKLSALSYAATCTAKYSAAEAIYWCNCDLAHSELPELFTQFDTFTHEIRTDYETNHSRQWVDIEFNRLEELFNNSVCSQSLKD